MNTDKYSSSVEFERWLRIQEYNDMLMRMNDSRMYQDGCMDPPAQERDWDYKHQLMDRIDYELSMFKSNQDSL